MPDQDVAVVIPNWNGEALLPRCLQSIRRHSVGLGVEIVVFDNGSDDGSLAILDLARRNLDLRVLRSAQNLGFAAACNAAVKAAVAPLILLLNNDAELVGDLRDGVDYLRANPHVGACQGPMLMRDGRHVDSVGSLLAASGFLRHVGLGSTIGTTPSQMKVFSVKGAAMWLRREALSGASPFDEDAFAYFEESDLCWRLWLRGWTVCYDNQLPTVVHDIGQTSSRLPRELCQFHSFKNRFRAVLRYTERRTLLSMFPRHIAWCLVIAAGLAIQGHPRQSVAAMRGLIWNARRASLIVQERRRIRAARAISDQELFAQVGTTLSLRDLRRQTAQGDDAEMRARAALLTTEQTRADSYP